MSYREAYPMISRLDDEALALWAGETEDVQDPRSGEIRGREAWVWLPIKSIDRPDVADITAITGKTETLRVQEWLAKDKGLI